MSSTYTSYPSSFEVLRPGVRGKALEMANLLIAEGYHDQVAQNIAIANVKQMACHKEWLSGVENKHVHLVPNPMGWSLISENVLTTYFTCDTKNEAMVKARSFAKNAKLKLMIHSEEGEINDTESFVVNTPFAVNSQPLISYDGREVILIDNKREVYNKTNFLSKRRHSQLMIDECDKA
jgi:hypothetical protein